jgi:magnesium chelatase family protein
MLSKIISGSLSGLETGLVTVETDFYNGLPALNMVGLASITVKEAGERIRAAIINSGHIFPNKRITINFSPASMRKDGSHFDLSIAVGILASSGELSQSITEKYAFIGELSLDGKINRVKGALPLVMGFRANGVNKIIIPMANLTEASIVNDVELFPAENFSQVIEHMKTETGIVRHEATGQNALVKSTYEEDYSDIYGQEHIKRVMVICAAGSHGVLLVGSPGVGKSMMARRLKTIMPDMTYDEMLEATKIYSVAGKLSDKSPLISERPFRAPYHTISPSAFTGGGKRPTPGEISLAHSGVLFLDEIFEFNRRTLDLLRQPIEDGYVTISRDGESVVFPCRSVLIAASNPCPCGYRGDPRNQCTCDEREIRNYVSRLSGPLLDRIDIQVAMGFAEYDEVEGEAEPETRSEAGIEPKVAQGYLCATSFDMKSDVERAVEIQRKRYAKEGILWNSQLSSVQVKKYCALNKEAKDFMRIAYDKMSLSVRGYHRILKVARTIADIDGARDISITHLAEALRYRKWDGEV